MSNGVSTSGVTTDALINNLIKGINGLGKYEIIYDRLSICPIELIKFNNYSFHSSDKFIEFTLAEYRNYQLKKVLS